MTAHEASLSAVTRPTDIDMVGGAGATVSVHEEVLERDVKVDIKIFNVTIIRSQNEVTIQYTVVTKI